MPKRLETFLWERLQGSRKKQGLEKVERSELSLLAAYYRSNNAGVWIPTCYRLSGQKNSKTQKTPKHSEKNNIIQSLQQCITHKAHYTSKIYQKEETGKRDPESRQKAAHRNQILNDPYVRISQGFLSKYYKYVQVFKGK